ncbi:MAG: hypothetical protein AAFZ80_13535, partial [Cyanobacteria bacterium P01_A01_bin.105]
MAMIRLCYGAMALLLTTTLVACSKAEDAVQTEAGASDAAAKVADAPTDAPAAAPAADVRPDSGEATEDRYTNDFFGFTVAYPPDWAVASDETAEELQEMGSDIVAGDDATLQASIEAAEQNTYQLLMVSEQPVGTPVTTFNPNVVVMAEKVSHLPGIASGAEYLANVSILLTQTELPYEAKGEPYEVEIGGRTFHRADFQLNAPG